MLLPKNPAILVAALAKLGRPHDTLPSALGADTDRNDQGMDMRTTLVKKNLEADDVLLRVSSCAPVIDFLCPLFDFRASLELAVVRLLVRIDGLTPEAKVRAAADMRL